LRLSINTYKSPKAAPDILRRTGSASSTFSHESVDVYSESEHVSRANRRAAETLSK
jgi:hypothetical protein